MMSGSYSTANGATWAVPKIVATLKPPASNAPIRASVAWFMPKRQPSAKSMKALGAPGFANPESVYQRSYSATDVKSPADSG